VGSTGKVFACEPFLPSVSALKRVSDLNAIGHIEIVPCALAETVGVVSFVPPASEAGSGLGHIATGSTADPSAIQVRTVTLDSLGSRIGHAALITIDAEGAEERILRGGLRYITSVQPVLVLEASPEWLKRAHSSIHSLYDTVAGLGYDIFHIGRLGLLPVCLDPAPARSNWIAIPKRIPHLRPAISRRLLAVGLLPFVGRLNPITRLGTAAGKENRA
jgi:FkbM family methyltransferase